MNNTLKLLSFLVPLSITLLSCQKETVVEKIPRVIVINSFDILEYPQARSNGISWDPLDGPDIYIQILNPTTSAVLFKQIPEFRDIVVGKLPLSVAVNWRLPDPTQSVLCQIMDFDTLTNDELMTQSLVIPYESAKGTPNVIEIKGFGYWLKLHVTYEF